MYAITDIETTGGYASGNGITEISIYVHDGNRVVQHFQTLINPVQRIPFYITALTGISDYMVKDAPLFEEVAEQIFELLDGKIFVAHNVNFDFSFINHHLKKAGCELKPQKLCTVRLGRKLFPGLPSYSLGNLCRHFEINIDNRHRADGDARATVLLFEHYLANGGAAAIEGMLKKSSGEQWLPMHLSKKDIEQLPHSPGVYYFHDAKDKVLYVGKAVNIKKRVCSHFTHNDADRKRQNFLRAIYKITFKQCATELQAIVLESTEIKRCWPKYNVSQKQRQEKYGLYTYEDNRGYIRLLIDKRKKHLPALYNFNLLYEGQVMLKKIAEEFSLNQKLCFIDKTPLTDNDLALLDAPEVYNGKIKTALTAMEKKLPTFAVLDEGINENEKLCLLIERGSFWGMGYVSGSHSILSSYELKSLLHPYADNDTIRNRIYAYVEQYPEKMVRLGQ